MVLSENMQTHLTQLCSNLRETLKVGYEVECKWRLIDLQEVRKYIEEEGLRCGWGEGCLVQPENLHILC